MADVVLLCSRFVVYLWFLTQFFSVFQSSNCVCSTSDEYLFQSSVVYRSAGCFCSVFDR